MTSTTQGYFLQLHELLPASTIYKDRVQNVQGMGVAQWLEH
jgi:hypothetical protein